MKTLFNDDWQFALKEIDNSSILSPVDFLQDSSQLSYESIQVPHDWMITDTLDLYKNSVGFYKKDFILQNTADSHVAIRFEGVYMNCAVWVNNKLAGEWKYGYSTFEFDISSLVHDGTNSILVIAVYQNPNTRWYSGAGIFRDVNLIQTQKTFLTTDGVYIRPRKIDENKWNVKISAEIAGNAENFTVINQLCTKNGDIIYESKNKLKPTLICTEEQTYLQQNVPSLQNYTLWQVQEEFVIQNPILWDVENPHFYITKTILLDAQQNRVDLITHHTGFRECVFDKDAGFFLNGRHLKLNGACHHHDHGALGSAFDVNALKRQFTKMQEMGINSVRCSHNPPPQAWLDLADEMGLLIIDEAFDMWERLKTNFDYGNYFNDWHQKDTISWVRKDRNHPSLLMWSIGNEIYDTHVGNGLQITKDLYQIVSRHDPEKNALITIASNYMMTDGAQECAKEIDLVGYNYLERLYKEHHTKYPNWKIYGSETSSTVQSRGIYHFPEDLTLVTYNDMQCSSLGNCTTTWGARSTQATITDDRDTPFSAGQYIWTAWDYIGEPTPYHSKNSFFGQIDTAGFEKDTFYLFKSEWTSYKKEPFVHLLPYWDFNENQIIDVKAYTNAPQVELFLNGKSVGKHQINHATDERPFGQWQLSYTKGEIKAVAYDENNNVIAEEVKKSFDDPSQIILKPETNKTGNLFFIQVITADSNGTLVENARNYITINVDGDAELVGMDNGDSTDYDQYVSKNRKTHSRKLFSNRLIAIVRAKDENTPFVVTAASKDLPNVSVKFNGSEFEQISANTNVKPEKDFVPTRSIKIVTSEKPNFTKENKEIHATATILPKNASIKEISWESVLKEGVSSDYVIVKNIVTKDSNVQEATLTATCDGECRLRVSANNGRDYPEILSELELTVNGVGNPKLNPYKMIEGCRHDDWDKNVGPVQAGFTGGISNRGVGATWISFSKVDFGTEGADTIHIPIFSFDSELPLEIWDGNPTNGECLLKATYKAQYVYNKYTENVFVLPKRLFGVHTIGIKFHTELVFHGFYFDQTPKALSKLRALDAETIVGDTFTKTSETVEGIGNNVNLDFANMDFGAEGTTKLTICGKSNTDNNTINVKFFNSDGTQTTQVVEFAHTENYEEKTFDLQKITGKNQVSFVFLPGCNFDFKWFKFS